MIDTISPEVVQLLNLLKEYSFDIETHSTDVVIERWLQEFDLIWISHAITEALYQGRYKLVSVEQILRLWQRRGHPIRHFNREFETIILGQSLLCYPAAAKPEDVKALLPKTEVINQVPGNESLQGNSRFSPNLLMEITQETPAISESAGRESMATGFQPNQDNVQPENLTSWFQSTMPVPQFHPVSSSGTGATYHPEPIRPFVPKQEMSAMHQRLKAVVQAGERQ